MKKKKSDLKGLFYTSIIFFGVAVVCKVIDTAVTELFKQFSGISQIIVYVGKGGLLFGTILLMIYIIIYAVRLFAKAYKYLHKFEGDRCFELIDDCKHGGNEDNYQYLLCFKKIDELYSDEEIQEYVNNGSLKKLFNRKKYLENSNKIVNVFGEVIVGVCASIMVSQFMLETKFDLLVYIGMIFVILLVCMVPMLIPYLNKEMQGHMDEIDKYEIEKINEVVHKIKKYNNVGSKTEKQLLVCETQRRIVEAIQQNKQLKKAYKKWLLNTNTHILPDLIDTIMIKGSLNKKPIAFALNKEKFEKKEAQCRKEKVDFELEIEGFKELLISEEYQEWFSIILKHFKEQLELEDAELKGDGKDIIGISFLQPKIK